MSAGKWTAVGADAGIAVAAGVVAGWEAAVGVILLSLVLCAFVWRYRYAGESIHSWSASRFSPEDSDRHWSKRRGRFFDKDPRRR